MCGIIGQINFNQQPVDQLHFNAMRDILVHRGPDGFGTQLLNNQTAALGHRRLSIIDLSESGKQPMCNETGTLWLTFNGEIYNYKDLKQQLQAKGHVFKSQTDSEVLLHGFEEWGMEALLTRLKGMFAFTIYDDKSKMLWAARDRFGIKPFYYYFDQQRLIFASEIKAIAACNQIEKEINHQALADFFIYSYVPNPNTIWKNIHKLPPAHYFSVCASNPIPNVKQYWQLQTNNLVIQEKEAIEKAYELIHQATQQHLVSDVPVGLFLSGGYDSTTLLMHATELNYKINTFSIGFEKSNKSEHIQAAEIANYFKATHHEKVLSQLDDYLSLLNKISGYYGEPFALSSMIPYYFVSEFASKHIKVAMAGDGADELFAGYNWYNKAEKLNENTTWRQKISQLRIGKKQWELKQYQSCMTGISNWLPLNEIFNSDFVKNIKKQEFQHFEKFFMPELEPVKRWQYLDTNTFIPEHCLMRADLSSMAHSIEVRVPFLDHELFEFVFSLSTKVYRKSGVKKFLLHENLKNKVPKTVFEMPKRGFSHHHLDAISNNQFYDFIESGNLVKNGVLERKKVQKVSQLGHIERFHFLMLELWFNNHGS